MKGVVVMVVAGRDDEVGTSVDSAVDIREEGLSMIEAAA